MARGISAHPRRQRKRGVKAEGKGSIANLRPERSFVLTHTAPTDFIFRALVCNKRKREQPPY
jgi:hypothetical protein